MLSSSTGSTALIETPPQFRNHGHKHLPHPSDLLEEDVGDQSQHPGREQADGTLVEGDDVLQGVDALLHGAGVDVVIDGGPDAPHRP